MTVRAPNRPEDSGMAELVEALRKLHEDKQRQAKPEAEPARRYQALRQSLESGEARVRQREAGIDREIQRQAAPYQETLYLQVARGGRTAGRFRCENRLAETAEVRVALRRVTLAGAALAPSPRLVVTPERFQLAPGASAVLTLTLDLASLPELASGKLETAVDLVMNDGLALKLWIEADVYELA
jgi:hypothetical protein